jgi:ligand-binding sensor domain-containing protein
LYHYILKILFCFLYTILSATITISQTLTFKTFNSENGLSQNSGYCSTQDGNGYIWFGTQDGLNRYNGRKIVTYYKETITRGYLCNNYIKSLLYDSASNWLWIGTSKGLCIYNCTLDSFYNASNYFPNANILDGIMIGNISTINKNEIAVCTNTEGFFTFNTKTKKVAQYFSSTTQKNKSRTVNNWHNKLYSITNGQLYALDNLSMPVIQTNMGDVRNAIVWQNDLWVASADKGLFKISHAQQPTISLQNFGSTAIGSLLIDNQNNLWIGSRDKGLIIVEPNNLKVLHSFANASNQNEWPKKFTLSLFKDKQNIIWIGSSGGGFTSSILLKNDFEIIQKKETLRGKEAHNMILSMHKINQHTLYLGTQLEGLRMYNTVTKEIISYPLKTNSASNAIYGITSCNENSLWLATAGGMYNFNTSTKKFTHYADTKFEATLGGQAICKLPNCDTLLYSSNHGLVLFNTIKKTFSNLEIAGKEDIAKTISAYFFYEDEEKNIWIGCQGYGLVKYSFKNKVFSFFKKIAKISSNIYSIKNINNNLWLASSNGLIVYDSKKDTIIKIINAATGLAGNVAYSIEVDNNNFIWCSTNAGLLKVNPSNYQILHIHPSAGLQASEFNAACSFKDTNGMLFFGGISGVSYFNPSNINYSSFSPTPFIESVKIFNTEIALGQNILNVNHINLKHNENFITFEFAVTNYINALENVFKYKLDNLDKDWIEAGSRNYANYSNLPPGNYTLMLQSANSNGVWSKEIKKLAITIKHAWWQMRWLQLLFAIIAASVLFYLIMLRIKTIRKEAGLKQKIAETEMQALRAQMNPHFIFNSLNSIENFMMQNEKRLASDYLNKFARLIRMILDSSRNEIVPIAVDLEALQLYIDLEQLRFNNKFTYKTNIDPALLTGEYRVPSLLIQPYVENAIVHGLAHSENENLVLTVSAILENDTIKYSIQDNGIGRQQAAVYNLHNKPQHKSVGLQITEDRINHFNNEAFDAIKITDLYNENNKPCGTKIEVTIKAI